MQNDAENDVFVARIECVSWRDVLHSQAARRHAGLAADARRRFDQARECLSIANRAAHAAGCWPPLLDALGTDHARPYHERAVEVWDAYAERADKTAAPSPPVFCPYPGCSARSHVHTRAGSNKSGDPLRDRRRSVSQA